VVLVWLAVSGRWRAPERPSALSTKTAALRAAAQERLIRWVLPARARAQAVSALPDPEQEKLEEQKETRGAF
jgi:hypothetical protein